MLHTEKELIENNKFQSFRLARLFHKDEKLFQEVCLHLPFSAGTHYRDSLNLAFTNDIFSQLVEVSKDDILSGGLMLIRDISDTDLLDQAVSTIAAFEKKRRLLQRLLLFSAHED